jgi:hypothetical protein
MTNADPFVESGADIAPVAWCAIDIVATGSARKLVGIQNEFVAVGGIRMWMGKAGARWKIVFCGIAAWRFCAAFARRFYSAG